MKELILKSGRDRSALNRHPWIFSGGVKVMPDAENGEIIEVKDNHKKTLGYAFYSDQSQITARIFEFTDAALKIDDAYWMDKIIKAATMRKLCIDINHTNTYRLLHAEGDFLPGVIVDVYHEVAVVQLLIRGTELIKDALFKSLKALGLKYIYLKTKQTTQRLEQVLSSGWVSERAEMPVQVKEYGVKFWIDVETGQKTGFFIDQRENRKLLGSMCMGKKVLNTFSYSGGFSLYALEGGATLVHSVDSSKEAIEWCDKNVLLNQYQGLHQSFVQDVFEFMKTSHEDYDIMVLDPPAFAKNAKSLPNAIRGYKNLNLTALQKIKPGGLIFTFSCSQHMDKDLFRKVVFGAAADAKRNVRIMKQLSQPEDHPINIYHPEGEYLKGLLLHVE